MGDMDKPAPWYVYVGTGLALTSVGCVSNSQWKWGLITGALSIVVCLYGYWRFRRTVVRVSDHAACLERTFYLEKDLGFSHTVPTPVKEVLITKDSLIVTKKLAGGGGHAHEKGRSCSSCDQNKYAVLPGQPSVPWQPSEVEEVLDW